MPSLTSFVAAGDRSAVDGWLDGLTAAVAGRVRVVQDRATVKAVSFTGDAFCRQDSLASLARPGSGVHVVAQWAGMHVHVHEGDAIELDVAAGREVGYVLVAGPRAYDLYRAGSEAVMGPRSLGNMIGRHGRVHPLGDRPVSVLLDARTGLVRPGSPVADLWSDPVLTWELDAVTLTDVALGRRLRDTCDPDVDSARGGWAPWAWDALTAWASGSDVSAGEAARAVLCAAAAPFLGPVPYQSVDLLAGLDAPAGDLVAAARALAPAGMSCEDLAVALRALLLEPTG